MKIFNGASGNQPKSWEGKVNFVDRNNVVLGFDEGQSCCESFGYFFSTEVLKDIPQEERASDPSASDLERYVFDPSFVVEDPLNQSDSGGSRTFKLIDHRLTSEDKVLYLTIYNFHNGYYGHGFTFETPTKTIDGCL